MSRYYDMDGTALGLMDWAKKFEGGEARQVGYEKRGEIVVSTVWLGLDHNFGSGPPLIFETMIFGGNHDQYQERYSTRSEAEAGHACALTLAFGDPS